MAELEMELVGAPAARRANPRAARIARRAWSATWPKLAAAAIGLGLWQLVVSLGFWPDYLLPGPGAVVARLAADSGRSDFYLALGITLQRAAGDYAAALAIGSLLGVAVAASRLLRRAVGSMITGLQSMPTIAWFPLAILLFGLSERAILFVVVLGAAPSVANGLISGIDQVPPLLLRAARVIGARGPSLYRHVVLPAALPAFVGGLKQGWAFAWRSLMAGELLVNVVGHPSLGVRLQFARELADAEGLLAAMIVLLLIGMVVDGVFGVVERRIRAQWGLAG